MRTKRAFMIKNAILAISIVAAAPGFSQTGAAFTFQRTIQLPSVTGKFDHFAIDTSGNRLFAAATGNHSVEVVDLATGKVQQSITGLGKPHGLAWVAATQSLYVADGSLKALLVYTGSPLKAAGKLMLSDDADDMVYDPATKSLFVGHGGSDAANPARIAIVDTRTFTQKANAEVATHPEALDLDAESGRVFANIADSSEVAVIDRGSKSVSTHWKLARAADNVPMAYDAEHKLLFIACRKPAALLVLDGVTGQELSRLPAAAGADDVFYDPVLHRVYVICGAGEVDSYQLSGRNAPIALAPLTTASGAKTALFVPSQSLLYVGIPGVDGAGGHPAEIGVYATQVK